MATKKDAKVEYVVAPTGPVWVLRMKGDSQTEVFASKEAAFQRGKRLVEDYVWGHITVLNPAGGIETEYLHDERNSPEPG